MSESTTTNNGAARESAPLAASQKQINFFNSLVRKAQRMNANERKKVNASPELRAVRDEYRYDEPELPENISSAEIEIPQMPTTLHEISEVISDFKWRVSRRELTNLTEALGQAAAPLRHDMTLIYDETLRELGHSQIYSHDHITKDSPLVRSFRERLDERGPAALNGPDFVTAWERTGLDAADLPLDDRNGLLITSDISDDPAAFADGLIDRLAESHMHQVRACFDDQQALITKKLHPVKQAHVDFEVARLSILREQKIRGVEVPAADPTSPRAQQLRHMSDQLRLLRSLPTRRMNDKYAQLMRATGHKEHEPEEISTFAGMRETIGRLKEIADAKAAKQREALGDAAIPEEEPEQSGSFGSQLSSEGGTFVQFDEFDRSGEDYYDRHEPATVNLDKDELAAAAKRERIGTTADDDYVNLVKGQVSQVGVGKTLAAHPELPAVLARHLPKDSLPINEEGELELIPVGSESLKECALNLLDRLAEARALEVKAFQNSLEPSSTPQAARGVWGDGDYQRAPSKVQVNLVRALAEQTGVELMPSDWKPVAYNASAFPTKVAEPTTSVEASRLIETFKDHIEHNDELARTIGDVRSLSEEMFELVCKQMPVKDVAFLTERFRDGDTRQQLMSRHEMNPQTIAAKEKVVCSKVQKAMDSARNSAARTAAATEARSAAGRAIPL